MSGNGFDPASFGAGFGGGQAKGRAEADAAVGRANNRANEAENSEKGAQNTSLALAYKVGQLNSEINNRWIPYAVTLGASLVARKVEREDLIAALKRLDPVNAEQITKDANQHRLDEYATLNGEKLKPIVDNIFEKSEEERTDR